MYYKVLRFISFVILKLLFRFQIKGSENIPKEGNFILACNHISYLDPIVLGAGYPGKINFIARHDLFTNRFLGWLLLKLTVIPLKRNVADIWALKEALRRIENGGNIALFPEGSRAVKGEYRQPLGGIGFLIKKTSVPIIPALIKGTDKALPKGAKFIKLSKISIHFGREVSLDKSKSHQEIAQQVMENIRILDLD